MSWQTTYNPVVDILHVLPVADLIEHPLNADCACGPTCEPIERDDGTIGSIYNHNALDGRE